MRLRNALQVIAGVLRSAVRNPRATADALKLLPSGMRGAQFARETTLLASSNGAEPADRPNPLRSYFDAHRKGPGIWKWQHYFDIYHRHFERFVGREVAVLEVGIYSGGSLPMWREYFGPGCRIYGVDIEEACRAYRGEGIEVFIGDQADRAFWARLRRETPRIDILIDDGGHQPEQQIVTLEEMLPHLSPGGIYLCEDIHGAPNAFAAYLHGLASQMNCAAPPDLRAGASEVAYASSRLQAAIASIHLYPFAAVIEKRARPLDELIAPKHGTQWQPFL